MRTTAVLCAAALVLAACGGDDASDEAIDLTGPPDTSVEGEVRILHALTGETDTAGLRAMIAAFDAAYPNITVQEQGTGDFESLARTRVGTGQAPDIILHPQPGLLADFYNAGHTRILAAPEDRLRDELVGGLVDLGTVNGDFVAVPVRLSLKSLVWYNKPFWDAQGYQIPGTWDDLMALTERIASETDLAPWCIGIFSGDATGWVATDWVEDILLRTIGPDAYDQWVEGELGFASDEVSGAIEEYMVPIWTNDDYVDGGRSQIAREDFGTAVLGILDGEDGDCVMHRQATFIEGFIAENRPDAEYGVDYDFFMLPEIDPQWGTPALGGGDFAAMYTDNPAAAEFMKFIMTAESGEPWAAEGAYLSPFATFDLSVYPTASTTRAGELLADATSFRFDGSDLMPSEVGASSQPGSFWREMTDWISGEKSLDDALEAIDTFFARF